MWPWIAVRRMRSPITQAAITANLDRQNQNGDEVADRLLIASGPAYRYLLATLLRDALDVIP